MAVGALPYWRTPAVRKKGVFMADCKIFGKLYSKNINVDISEIKVELTNEA